MALKAFNLFGNKNNPKSPPEIVRSLKDLLYKLREPTTSTKVRQSQMIGAAFTDLHADRSRTMQRNTCHR
jgi:hypothetical protein